jgi:hypothetical protein
MKVDLSAKRNSGPEHISSILIRVMDDLGKKYMKRSSGCPVDRKRDASTISARLPVEGENDAQHT